MSDGKEYDMPAIYQIHVKGILDISWSDWFDGFSITSTQDETKLTGLVADQAALQGILTKLNDLGLVIIAMTRVGGEQQQTP